MPRILLTLLIFCLAEGRTWGAEEPREPGSQGSEPAEMPAEMIVQPQAWQVVQRVGFVLKDSYPHAVGGPQRGYADVLVEIADAVALQPTLEARVVARADQDQVVVDWRPLEQVEVQGEKLQGRLRVPAGGWYRLEIRAAGAKEFAVEPFGVGEVLVIAGQSYAAGANDALMKVNDPQQRVSAWDPQTGGWQLADDPQPQRGDGGTIWPPLGDHLAGLLDVPIGFVNVAVGGTASRQWLPGEALYAGLLEATQKQPGFRAVLWQQGESDVIERTSTEQYVRHLVAIRLVLEQQLGRSIPWLLAKSTLHPTVYQRPEEEAAIRAAIDRLVADHGFRPGPDTDLLGGENRGGPESRRHFSPIGQQRAALLWLVAVWNELDAQD